MMQNGVEHAVPWMQKHIAELKAIIEQQRELIVQQQEIIKNLTEEEGDGDAGTGGPRSP